MKLVSSIVLCSLGSVFATTPVSFTEGGDVNKNVNDNGKIEIAERVVFTKLNSQGESEDDQDDQTEIDERIKLVDETPTYPFGPLKGDLKIPGADDAVSDAISLPTSLKFFDDSTDIIRLSTNGMIILDDVQAFNYDPSIFPVEEIDAPFVAGYWNDFWSKKTGKLFWRMEEDKSVLDTIQSDISKGFPELTDLGKLEWAVIFSFYKVTFFGAKKVKPNPFLTNTFQIVLTTDGKYSFLMNNYLDLQWDKSTGVDNKAIAGFDFNNERFLMADGSMVDPMNWVNTSTNSGGVAGRHIYRLDEEVAPEDEDDSNDDDDSNDEDNDDEGNDEDDDNNDGDNNDGDEGNDEDNDGNDGDDNNDGDDENEQTEIPTDTVIEVNRWPQNNNTMGGGIFKFKPSIPVGNGTCTIVFPSEVGYFHVFDAHIKSDSIAVGTVWNLVAANSAFEPNPETGTFTFLVMFEFNSIFDTDQITMSCKSDDEWTFAVYSFPQNHLRKDARTNIRTFGNVWNKEGEYNVIFPESIDNLRFDDPRIILANQSEDNSTFTITSIPEIEEVWMQWDYINYFASNTVQISGPWFN